MSIFIHTLNLNMTGSKNEVTVVTSDTKKKTTKTGLQRKLSALQVIFRHFFDYCLCFSFAVTFSVQVAHTKA
jgi:hypothetical protein